MNDLPECSTEGERSLIKNFVRSLSMPHELLMSMRNFFKHGQVENWLGQAKSVICLPEGLAGIQDFVEPWYSRHSYQEQKLRKRIKPPCAIAPVMQTSCTPNMKISTQILRSINLSI